MKVIPVRDKNMRFNMALPSSKGESSHGIIMGMDSGLQHRRGTPSQVVDVEPLSLRFRPAERE